VVCVFIAMATCLPSCCLAMAWEHVYWAIALQQQGWGGHTDRKVMSCKTLMFSNKKSWIKIQHVILASKKQVRTKAFSKATVFNTTHIVSSRRQQRITCE
jgi:hypothetical protein